jgi:hypothetical protein
MQADIQGELVPLSSIPEFSDIKLIRKVRHDQKSATMKLHCVSNINTFRPLQYYQLNDNNLSDNIDELMPLIAGAMALKEIK